VSTALPPIQIVGAGIGGLSTAVALARKGFAVEIHERAGQISEVGAGIQLGPNAFRAFEQLGIQHAIEKIAFQPDAIVLMDSPSGTEICRQDVGRPFLERFAYPYRVGYRADVQRVLLEATRDYRDRIAIHLDRPIRAFTQDEGGVTLFAENGLSVSGSALIGADGLWSMIRNSIIGDGRPRTPGHVAYRAVLPVASLPADLLSDDVQIWVGPRHHVVCYKLRAGTLFNIVAIFQSTRYAEDWDSEADIQDLQKGFEDACPALKRLLGHLQTWRMWVLCDRDPTPGWTVGRATLLGDAAHPTLPYLAQGACMAIEDAVCLAEYLGEEPGNIPAALSRYESARFPRTANVQLVSRRMGEANHASGEAREARNRALAARNPRDYESTAWLFDAEDLRTARSVNESFWSPATSTE
jgi:3-hydroxybenzoate 6-monooxygenase